jgi:periplasmic protein TonB
MFEGMQVVESTNKTWTVLLSATMQTAAVGSAVLLSVLQSQMLDLRGIIQPPPLVAPSRPPAVQVVAVERAGGSSHPNLPAQAPKPFAEPSKIPNRVVAITDPDPGGPATGGVSTDGFIWSDSAAPLARFIGAIGTAPIHVTPPAVTPKDPVKSVPREPLRIGGNVLEASLVHKVVPVYPPIARSMRISGTVHLIGVIGRDGSVQHLQVVDGHPLLTPAALAAVRQWIYRPTLLNGEPVEVVAPIEVKFLLN